MVSQKASALMQILPLPSLCANHRFRGAAQGEDLAAGFRNLLVPGCKLVEKLTHESVD